MRLEGWNATTGLAAIFGDDQVDPGSLEITGEKQMRIRHDNRTGWYVRRDRPEVYLLARMRAQTADWQLGVKFAGKVHDHPQG